MSSKPHLLFVVSRHDLNSSKVTSRFPCSEIAKPLMLFILFCLLLLHVLHTLSTMRNEINAIFKCCVEVTWWCFVAGDKTYKAYMHNPWLRCFFDWLAFMLRTLAKTCVCSSRSDTIYKMGIIILICPNKKLVKKWAIVYVYWTGLACNLLLVNICHDLPSRPSCGGALLPSINARCSSRDNRHLQFGIWPRFFEFWIASEMFYLWEMAFIWNGIGWVKYIVIWLHWNLLRSLTPRW